MGRYQQQCNPSVKFGRVKVYGGELAAPAMMALIAEFPTEDARSAAYLENGLMDPTLTPEEEAEETTTTSRNKDLYERMVVESGRMYRALNNAQNDAIIKNHAKAKELQAFLVEITRGLKALNAPTEDEDLVKFMKEVVKR